MSAQPYLRPTSALDRRTMGKYDVLCRLSTGGMSEIFLAYQKGLAGFRKIVVLKSILPDIRGEEEFVRMFLDEAKTTALFNHPHIAQVFDLDVDGETLFLAMEFVQGCTLVEMARACRQAKEPIPIGFTLLAVRDTALALHYAHTFTDPRGRKQTVIHRDVAEKNIMVTYDGTTKLLDFGIAKALGRASGRTSVGMVKGTSGYMSPEQIRGEPLDARSDVFSLGVVLHECLTGMRLFHGKTPEEGMLSALREEIPPPSRLNPDVIPSLDAVVMKSLMRDRESRYGTSLEFARAVEKAANGQLWHPEQSGELVLRHFTDRVNQTRELIESTQGATGEHTGEVKVGKLLAELQNARETGQPVDREKTRTDPGDKPMPPLPPPPVPLERNRATSASVTTSPPRAKAEGGRGSRTLPGEITNTRDTREVTDPAAAPGAQPLPPGAVPLRSKSIPVMPVVTAGAAVNVQLSGNPRDNYDDDDIGAKTIPAAVLPGGLYAVPAEAHAQARKPNPLPPPVPSAPPPPPLRTQDEITTNSGKGVSTASSGWETFDEEDDDPGVKTTIARPFDEPRARTDEHAELVDRDEHDRDDDGHQADDEADAPELGEEPDTRSEGRRPSSKLPRYLAGGLAVGLLALTGLMFALELGPFAGPVGPQPPKKLGGAATETPPPPPPPKEVKRPEPPSPKPEPVVVKPPEPVVVKPPEPVVARSPEPVVARSPEPVVVNPPEPVNPPPEPPKPPAPEPVVVRPPVPPPPQVEQDKKRPPPTDSRGSRKGGPRKKPAMVASKADEPEEKEPEPEPAPKPVEKEKASAAAATGTLTLVTTPPGLLVRLSGAELGNTPLFNKPVPVGRQTFKVISSSGEIRSLSIDIKPGANSTRQDFEALPK